ncbi:conjugal transfer protein TraF [Shewanella sp. JNE10-2]|uniref:conjugal transfer protein TraF n=1 Tax=Shewanella TaxID=22 RepID=UPI0020050AF5|nr:MULTISPECIES: conjugal transfer protein TraF [unclassified Shewanella]MCK7631393.1 conjugal transfer protein TraF [Shewanella sp. JNE9-1]MCK7646669.1 conjugal transfer protein TraF [Shewanella sp. JNE3-1]MCK7654653.1 conjugal transfer protein TraF [Shewanella sp. JNE4-1]UPO28100.1 conjugal transfer protein TraF [Shewanella sp. JNE10-2]UPO35307.1 conjugal transfer protein TraF [Shewanella sp. JNE7]
MKKSVIALSVLASISNATWANSFDARKDAMGGVGVASAHYSAATPVNPALVAKYNESDDFSFVLPSIGAQGTDKDKLIDNIDNIKDAYDAFRIGANSATANKLASELAAVDGKLAMVNVGVNVQVAVPNKLVSLGFMANGYASAMVGADVAQSDLDYLQDVIDGTSAADPSRSLDSQALGVVALVQDYGVALAHQFELMDMPLYVGVTPKVQKVETYNYSATITDYDDSDLSDDQYRSSDSGFNADLGLALDAGNMTYGLAVRNLVSRDVDTATVNGATYTYQISPVATLAAAYRTDWLTAAIELDVNKSKAWLGKDESMFAAVEESQFAAVGVEFNAFDWAQIRAGFRSDIAGEQPDLFTAGFGLSPWSVFHLDLAGQVGSDKAVGAALTMSYTF